MIQEYHFGSITINGKTYSHDVEVRWTSAARGEPSPSGLEVLPWWRKESHIIEPEDVKRAVAEEPETIIIGTGESGVAKVTEPAQNFIKEKGIELLIDKTGEAVKTFNIVKEESKVIGLFHLTC